MDYAREYVECWELVKAENHGLILWGSVGTGKSYFAGCIANARIYDRLTEMCCPVCITGENFRKAKAQAKMERLKTLLNRKESL